MAWQRSRESLTAVVVVMELVTGVIRWHDHRCTNFLLPFLLVTGVVEVHVMVTGVMVGRDHLWTIFFFSFSFCNGRGGGSWVGHGRDWSSKALSRAWSCFVKMVTGVMGKKRRKKSLAVVTGLLTAVIVVHNHDHGRDHLWMKFSSPILL